MHPDTISKWFPQFRRKYGLSDVPFHGLRHTTTTILLDGGLNVKAVSSILGHAHAEMVTKVYGHFTKSAKKEAADIMERRLKKKNKPRQTEQYTPI